MLRGTKERRNNSRTHNSLRRDTDDMHDMDAITRPCSVHPDAERRGSRNFRVTNIFNSTLRRGYSKLKMLNLTTEFGSATTKRMPGEKMAACFADRLKNS